MAEKDASEKILESYNDVFSDIVNVLLFNGKQVLGADELEDQAPRTYYKEMAGSMKLNVMLPNDGRMVISGWRVLALKTRPHPTRICRSE